jgi:hypothetical protein
MPGFALDLRLSSRDCGPGLDACEIPGESGIITEPVRLPRSATDPAERAQVGNNLPCFGYSLLSNFPCHGRGKRPELPGERNPALRYNSSSRSFDADRERIGVCRAACAKPSIDLGVAIGDFIAARMASTLDPGGEVAPDCRPPARDCFGGWLASGNLCDPTSVADIETEPPVYECVGDRMGADLGDNLPLGGIASILQ